MKYLKYLSIYYVALMVLVFVSLFVLEPNKLEVGCYVTDALVIGAECKGFVGSSIMGLILNMPLMLFYAPLFGILGLIGSPFHLGSLYMLILGIALWLPILFLIYCKVRRIEIT